LVNPEVAMGKVVSVSEFKAHCLRLIDEMQQDGEPLTITRRGKVVAEVVPKREVPLKPVFGLLKNDAYRFDDPFTPVSDMEEWDASNPASLYRAP
jgi:prevent-host-death family protein